MLLFTVGLLATASAAGAGAGPFVVRDDSYTDGKFTAQLKVLENTQTGERASVIINAGGCVDELSLKTSSGKLHKVLWDHGRNATAVALNPTWRGRQLIPYANRVGGATYKFNGTTYKLPINDVAGLNNSLHGLLWDRSMTVARGDGGQDSAVLELRYQFDGSDPGYPFLLEVAVTYTLSPDGFQINVAATNRDADGWPLPFQNGWHPYFLATLHSATLTLDPCTEGWNHVEVAKGPQFPPPRYSNMVPTTQTRSWDRFNGSFTFGGNASAPTYFDDEVKALRPELCPNGGEMTHTLRDPTSGVETRLTVSPEFRYLQIFTGAMSTWGTDAVVLEPLSSMADAYNNHDGLRVISAGETYTNWYRVTLG